MTRLTFGFDEEYTIKGYKYWEKILSGERALIVEGEKTRFGVGNNLLKNFKHVNRILAPKHDAFSKCDAIIEYVETNINRDQTILIALGPAAKYIAFELYKKGYRVIDIGNLDIEYEWHLRGASKQRIVIPGKYTSEAKGGREVADIENLDSKVKYESEIITEFIK